MDFCSKCDNMLYLDYDENQTHKLIYRCKCCGNIENKLLDDRNLKVFSYEKNVSNIDIHINKYTKYDKTLPHLTTIKCPNENCPSNIEEGIENDVIYMRYDDKNMKYMYLCTHCDYNWKTTE